LEWLAFYKRYRAVPLKGFCFREKIWNMKTYKKNEDLISGHFHAYFVSTKNMEIFLKIA
jgi:hypothetical protein